MSGEVVARKSGEYEKCIGYRYGKLIIIEILGMLRHHTYVKCRCDCGGIRETTLNTLKIGRCVSCGCIRGIKNTIHGGSKRSGCDSLYIIYAGLRSRCNNKNNKGFKYYGGKGVSVKWKTYADFREWSLKNGYIKGLHIDRKNNNGHYSPKNCRWVTLQENANNKSNNRPIKFNNEVRNITEWARYLGINQGTMNNRVNYLGWSIERSFTTPVRKFTKPKRNPK